MYYLPNTHIHCYRKQCLLGPEVQRLNHGDRYTFNTAYTPAQIHNKDASPKLEFGRFHVSST